jgi:hypothetical protein
MKISTFHLKIFFEEKFCIQKIFIAFFVRYLLSLFFDMYNFYTFEKGTEKEQSFVEELIDRKGNK